MSELVYLGDSDFLLWLGLPEGTLLVHNGKGNSVLSLFYRQEA